MLVVELTVVNVCSEGSSIHVGEVSGAKKQHLLEISLDNKKGVLGVWFVFVFKTMMAKM